MPEETFKVPSDKIYPIDDWRIVQSQFSADTYPQDETLFATANGYLGIRGNFEEGHPVFQRGTFLNGFYESWPIKYPEEAFGFAKTGQTMLNVTDAHLIRLTVDGESFDLDGAQIEKFERILDMQKGTLSREVIWKTSHGKSIQIKSERLVSFEHRHLVAISYEVSLLDASAEIVISSEMICEEEIVDAKGDPRKSRSFEHEVFEPRMHKADEQRVTLCHQTHNSRLLLACGMDHVMKTENSCEVNSNLTESSGKITYSIKAEPQKKITLIKYISYHYQPEGNPEDLSSKIDHTLDDAKKEGFTNLLSSQRRFLDDFWSRSDIKIQGARPRAQQGVRLNLFHILQATGRAQEFGVGARGLTGTAYEGHTFWDTEIYVLPFLIYTEPDIAKNLLLFRYSSLDKARACARAVNQKGALFPWRTITGEEASAFFLAGTAQYHINADIMYALKKYVDVTGDEKFLFDCGAEMLFETARLWSDLGFFNEKDGAFHIHGVTGPDEYNALVDNNLYTNMMARENLRFASQAFELMQEKDPEALEALMAKINLSPDEIKDWKNDASKMYIPFDEERQLHPQDDQFLKRDVWDFENTPKEKYPLLLHYHPLVLYRSQVIKQADVIMAMLLLGHEFTLEQKRKNFDYYEPLTTGDSSLSACAQGIMALELGYRELAIKYLLKTALMDFADVCGNAQDGAHIAAMGGTWMGLVYGIAGMRDYNGRISFSPIYVQNLERMEFSLMIRGQLLLFHLTQDKVTYTLQQGSGLIIYHDDEEITLNQEQSVTKSLKVV